MSQSKPIAEIVSLKNEYGHFTIGYYAGDAPDMSKLPEFVRLDEKSWEDPQDPIIYQISAAEGFTAQTIQWMLNNTGVEL